MSTQNPSSTLLASLSLIRTSDAVAVAVGLYLLRVVIKRLRASNANSKNGTKNIEHLPLPPAPKGLPVLGNALQIPTGHAWLGYTQQHTDLSSEFASESAKSEASLPLTRLTALGTHIVITHAPEAAHALFEEKSAVFSDRPRVVFGGEMVGCEHTLALLRYGPRLKSYRKEMHQVRVVRVHGYSASCFLNRCADFAGLVSH